MVTIRAPVSATVPLALAALTSIAIELVRGVTVTLVPPGAEAKNALRSAE